MIRITSIAALSGLLFVPMVVPNCSESPEAVQRPEKIVSLRQVVYDQETYRRLADLWKKYNDEYPSEDAYANWMYAARYAGESNYESLLKKGVSEYPANPTLLYLESMLHHGSNSAEGLALLERATRLDPSYTDPWFALVDYYMEQGEKEKTNVALRKLLESGVVQDEVMDFSYNMFACLEPNALLVTNGDNDTYPGWILTRVVGYRPDVRVVNRSLLNTDWYPFVLMKEGVPNFVTQDEMNSLGQSVEEQLNAVRAGRAPAPPSALQSDSLLARILKTATRVGRPVYVAATVERTGLVEQLVNSGRELGLVTLVTPPAEPDRVQLRRTLDAWLKEFRTNGMDDWGVRYASPTQAGRMLMINYATCLHAMMDRILTEAPDFRPALFRWYQEHAMPLIPGKHLDELNRMWCRSQDIREIRDWCRKLNYTN